MRTLHLKTAADDKDPLYNCRVTKTALLVPGWECRMQMLDTVSVAAKTPNCLKRRRLLGWSQGCNVNWNVINTVRKPRARSKIAEAAMLRQQVKYLTNQHYNEILWCCRDARFSRCKKTCSHCTDYTEPLTQRYPTRSPTLTLDPEP